MGTDRDVHMAGADGTFVLHPRISDNVQAITSTASGHVWAVGGRVHRLDPPTATSEDPARPFSRPLVSQGVPERIVSALVDREGNLWLGVQGGGLMRLRSRPLRRVRLAVLTRKPTAQANLQRGRHGVRVVRRAVQIEDDSADVIEALHVRCILHETKP